MQIINENNNSKTSYQEHEATSSFVIHCLVYSLVV